MNIQRIYLGGDHAGFELKEVVKKHLETKQIEYIDLGAFSTESIDYPDIAREVGEKVMENQGSYGILICGTGIGVSMAANKVKGVRAALCTSEEMAAKTREHNDANVLCIGSRITSEALALKMIDKFFATDFSSEERHQRRVDKIDS